jgi:outer membrane lipoprotein SlyB
MAAGFGSGSGGIGAAGAVIGAILGAGAEVASTSQEGVEATILLDDGSLITVVQGSSEKFSPGDRVKLIAYKKRDGEVEVRFTRTTIPYQDPPQSKGLGS